MSELNGIYALWYREFKVFQRERSRVVSSIINPILWLVIFGGGLGSSISIGNFNYQSFIYPGVLVQVALFSSVFFGAYIVWDRKIDFLKEVLVAPLSRTSIFVGKILGGTTDSLLQIFILLVIGFGFMQIGLISGIQMNVVSIFLTIIILFITIVSMVSIGLIIGSQMESPEGFQLIVSFLIFPLFFLSGALFPINNLPGWLAPFIFLDPLTYSVDGLRAVLLGVSKFHVLFDVGIIGLFSLAMILIGTYAFKKMKV